MEPGDNNGNIDRNLENDNSASMTFSANLTMPRMTDTRESNLFDNNSRSSLHDLENNNDCEGTFVYLN